MTGGWGLCLWHKCPDGLGQVTSPLQESEPVLFSSILLLASPLCINVPAYSWGPLLKRLKQLKLASFLALDCDGSTHHIFCFVERKSSVSRKKAKTNNENLYLSLPVGAAKNFPGFLCMWYLMQHSADPMLLQQQNKEISLLRLAFVPKAFLGSGFVVSRWKCLPAAHHFTSAQIIRIYKEAWRVWLSWVIM